MARGKDKKWIQKAIKKPGAFREWCIRRGYSGVTKACIEEGKRSKNPTTRRRAVLAETLMKLRKKKKKKK
ncbi:MAG: hypothetical protein QW607_05645 [Desulfurococcaceae archaeon]